MSEHIATQTATRPAPAGAITLLFLAFGWATLGMLYMSSTVLEGSANHPVFKFGIPAVYICMALVSPLCVMVSARSYSLFTDRYSLAAWVASSVSMSVLGYIGLRLFFTVPQQLDVPFWIVLSVVFAAIARRSNYSWAAGRNE